ncbi:MAG: gamma-glutamyltransferase [Myxococcales bacterium]|nr:gamma-glutamyltransferase [Myxococcales bacterium]MCB9533300.1 gamma-glutamyltransferase [Myxococcales bacterium]
MRQGLARRGELGGAGLFVFAAVAICAPVTGIASELLVAPTAVVAADNPIASAAGIEVLRRGGNAIDAAVAVGLTLGIVNPFASGLGGGGFLLYRDAATGDVFALDFREVAPAGATRDMYVGADGELVAGASTFGGLAVAVPGEAAGWEAAHSRFGALPWADVVEPARRLAADGFEVGPLLERRLADDSRLAEAPGLRSTYEGGDGALVTAGVALERPDLAWTLERMRDEGANGFYSGPVADDIVTAVEAAGGVLTLDDLASYRPRWVEPVLSQYRGATVYGMPSPSSGGLVVAEVLGVLDAFSLERVAYTDTITAHIIAQAFAHGFADRAWYLGDDAFFDVPVERFVSAERRAEILDAYDPVRTLEAQAYAPLVAPPADAGTSHFSIVDAAGNAVACTVTINTSFGSHVLAPRSGVLLNNQMDDFSAQPGRPNAFGLVGSDANAIAPGKRPLSSMSPTILADDDGLLGVLGGSGGPMIITETVLGIVQMLDFGTTADVAVSTPRFHQQWLPATISVEEGSPWRDLDDFGYTITPVDHFWSALQIVWRHPGGWQAASDPRKLGAPSGY